MKEIKVVHCKKESFDIYIGRGSKWGNPFEIGVDGNREEVISRYERYIMQKPALIEALPELIGKTLGCWCKPDKACHGDVLKRLVNDLFKCSWCGESHYGGPEYCQS